MSGAAGGLEGMVAVRLAVADGRVRSANVTIRRPTAAARALAGRSPEEASRLVPLLFSLCGTAQAAAAVAALEEALGIAPGAHATARALLVAVETVESHAWQALMEWPRLLAEPPQPQPLAALRAATAALRPALYPGRDGLRPGGGVLRPDGEALAKALSAIALHLERAVFAGPPPADEAALNAWAAEGVTPAARLMRRVLEPGLAGFGACAVAPLAGHPAVWFGERLASDARFSDEPHQDGAPAHTGPLARRQNHPLVAGLLRRHGSGLAAHIAARLADLAAWTDRLTALARTLEPADPVPGSGGGPGGGPGRGCGAVETARGRLAHWVRLENGRIADFRTVAPTEWNFAAGGPLAHGLEGIRAGEDLPARAGLLVAALDACVACTVTVEQEG